MLGTADWRLFKYTGDRGLQTIQVYWGLRTADYSSILGTEDCRLWTSYQLLPPFQESLQIPKPLRKLPVLHNGCPFDNFFPVFSEE